MVLMPGFLALTLHRAAATTNPTAEWTTSQDAKASITIYRMGGGRTKVPRNEYILGVLAAEINPDAPMAALEAAAIAARTYAVHSVENPSAHSTYAVQHGADVTDNPRIDLPWLSDSEQEAKYGSHFGFMRARLEQAILATDDVILTDHQQPILAFTTEITAGSTRTAVGSMHTAAPYLKAVACPADRGAAGVKRTYTFTRQQVAKALGVATSSLTQTNLKLAQTDAQGYVLTVTVGKRSWTGDAFADCLQLPSPWFRLRVQGDALTITVVGRGSGYGLSLHQAVAWARQGRSCDWILRTFYPGAHLVRA
jgi:stage II sporulation protein D